jgi:hypothetical protein
MAERNWQTRDLWEKMGDCPFCAASASEFNTSLSYSENLEGVLTGFMGECSECGAMGPLAATELHALHLWNFRPASGTETEGQDRADGLGAEHESPAPKGDAQWNSSQW